LGVKQFLLIPPLANLSPSFETMAPLLDDRFTVCQSSAGGMLINDVWQQSSKCRRKTYHNAQSHVTCDDDTAAPEWPQLHDLYTTT